MMMHKLPRLIVIAQFFILMTLGQQSWQEQQQITASIDYAGTTTTTTATASNTTNECGLKCLKCEFNKLCSQCEDGFALSAETQKCRSIMCEENEYLFEGNKRCLEICPSQYLADNVYRICVQLPDCPLLEERGQNYYDSFTNALMTENWIVSYGQMQQLEDYSLKLFRRQDVIYKGELIGHTSVILGMHSSKVYNDITMSYDNELITFSAKEVIIWNIDFGYIRSKFTYDNSLKASSMHYLDSDILILNVNEFQFAVCFLNLDSTQLNLLQQLNLSSQLQASNLLNQQQQDLINQSFEQHQLNNDDKNNDISDENNKIIKNNKRMLQTTNDSNNLNNNSNNNQNKIDSKIKTVIYKQQHTKVLKGFFRVGYYLYSYALDSLIIKYDLNQLGKSDGITVCSIPQSLIVTSTKITQNQKYVFLILADQQKFGLLVVETNQCIVVDQSNLHSYPILNIYLDSTQNAFFSVSSTRAIFQSYDIILDKINAIYDPQMNIKVIQQINIFAKTKIWVQQSHFILVQQRGQILISLIQGQQQLLEKYTLDLQYDYDFELNQVIMDLQNSRAVFFGAELISLGLDAGMNTASIEDRQKNILKTQAFHMSEVNGVIFDDQYSRVISYSSDGMILVYESSSFFESKGNDNISSSDRRKRQSLSGYSIVMSGLHPSCTMEQYRAGACTKGVVNMIKVRYNLFGALYNDNTIIMWNYNQYDLSVAATLQPTDTKAAFVNMFAQGTNFVFCNTKEMLVYKVDTYTLVRKYVNSFDFCALDKISGVDHILFIKNSVKNVYVVQLSNSTVKYTYPYSGTVSKPAVYYAAQKTLVFATTSSYVYYLIFPVITTGAIRLSVNTPLSMAYNPITTNILVFSSNFAASYYTAKSTLQRSFKTLAAFTASQSILALSNPEMFIYYQNTGINAIQNQVFVLGSNFDYKMILTFEDKISSISANPLTKKLFIGFENGIVRVGNIDQKSLILDDPVGFDNIEVDNTLKLMFGYSADIHVYDQILLSKKYILTAVHDPLVPLTGILISASTNSLVSYNNGLTKNLVKWDLQTGQGTLVPVSHTQPIMVIYLDDTDDVLITISSDLNMFMRSYANIAAPVQSLNQHTSRKARLDIEEYDFDPEFKTIYSIVFNAFDASCNKLMTTNNIGELYLIDYIKNTQVVVQFMQISNIYIDYQYQRIIILILEDYSYKFVAYQYTNTLDQISINYLHDYKTKIRGVLFQSNYFYSYEDSIIKIMKRTDYSFVSQIVCPNPIITNFIVFSKLNQVIIWSDVSTGFTNTNIGIYDFVTGQKITDIVKYQLIEDGQIHKVAIDEEKYTLIVSKIGNFNFLFTIDLRTFLYTGYYTASFNTAINSLKVFPNSYLFTVADATNFRVYNYETATYNMNQFLQINKYKNFKSYYNEFEKRVYYFDANNQGWEFSVDSKIVKSKESIYGVKFTKYWQEYLYVVAQDYLLKYSKRMVLVGRVESNSNDVYFSDNFIFFTTSDSILIQIDINGFKLTSFRKTLEDKLTDLIVVEQYEEVFISLANNRIYRFSLKSGNVIQFYDTMANFQFFMIDTINKAILHVFTNGNIEIYYNYTKEIFDYRSQPTKKIISNISQIYQILIDNDSKRIFILSIDSILPHIKAYTYSYLADGSLDNNTLIKIISAPSFSTLSTMKMTATSLDYLVPWQVVKFNMNTLEIGSTFRDAKIFYDSQSYISFTNNNQQFLFVSTNDSISFYRWSTTALALVLQFKFPLDYPILISYNIASLQDAYFKVSLQGVSSGKFFTSNFIVPNTKYDGSQAALDQCFLITPVIEYNFEVDNQLKSLESSQVQLGLKFDKIALSLIGKKSFYYSNWMEKFSSQVIYAKGVVTEFDEVQSNDASGSKLNQDDNQIIQLTQNSFISNSLEEIDIIGYTLSIFGADEIKFNSKTKRVILKSITFVGNTNHFSLTFTNMDQVTLKDIKIYDLSINNSTVLFKFLNCTSVWIEEFDIQNINILNNSSLFYFENVKTISINQFNITKLIQFSPSIQLTSNKLSLDSIDSVSNQNIDMSSRTTYTEEDCEQSPIYFSNIKQITIVQCVFNNIQHHSNFMHLIQSEGALKQIMTNITFINTQRSGFLDSMNEFEINQQVNILHNDLTEMTNLQFQKNYNLTSNLIRFKGQKLTVSSSQFQNIICSTCQGSVFFIQYSLNILFLKNTFEGIEGQSGSAISFLNNGYSNAKIEGCTFKSCKSTAVGGAIFLDNSDLMINNTSIQQCSANIGGAIRYINLEPKFVYYNNLFKKTNNMEYYLNNDITNNIGYIYGQNIGSYPLTIQIQPMVDQFNPVELSEINTNNNENNNEGSEIDNPYNIDTYKLNQFQSGSEVNFKMRILDQENNPIKFSLSDYNNNKYPEEINEEIQKFKIKVETKNESIKIFGQYATDYTQFNEEDSSFTIKQMMIISDPESQNLITFQTPSISKVLNPTEDNRAVSQGSFYVSLMIDFRKCIRGEIYKYSGSIMLCQECKDGTYSLEIPTKEKMDSQMCKRCPMSAEYCIRDQMVLKPGYWKYENNTDSILSCKNKPENCEGPEEKNYCIEGQLGPLCEQCDVFGEIWGESYQSDGKYGCVKCSKITNPVYMIPTILFGLGMIIYILISIRVALSISIKITSGYYLRFLKVIPISKSCYNDTTNMNMKAMMNFMQISTMINTFTVKLPDFMTFLPQYLGSPIQNLAYTFDCHLSKLEMSHEIPLIYLRTLWTLLIPIFYLIGIGIAYTFLVLIRVSKFNKSQIISGLVFMIFFTQPNMIQSILGVMSCRQIDDRFYILSDISYECYTDTHLKYIALICFPGLILYGFLIPLYILRILCRFRNNLDYAHVRLKYGFLFQDYKNSCFYWEFIKSYKKMIIILILQFYGDPFNNKLVIILVVLLIYLVALLRVKPYLLLKFQEREKKSMCLIIVLLITNIFLYNKPDLIQQYIFYVLLIGVDNTYQFILVLDVLVANTKVMFPLRYNQFIKKLLSFLPFLSRFIQVQKFIRYNTFLHWKTIRKHLKDYQNQKKSMGESCSLAVKTKDENDRIVKLDQSLSCLSKRTLDRNSFRQPANTVHPALSSSLTSKYNNMENLFSEQILSINNLLIKDKKEFGSYNIINLNSDNNRETSKYPECQIFLSSCNNMFDCQLSPASSLSLREQVELLNHNSKEKKSDEDDQSENDADLLKRRTTFRTRSHSFVEIKNIIYKNLQPIPIDQQMQERIALQMHKKQVHDSLEISRNSDRHITIKKDDVDYDQLDEKLLVKKKITNHTFNDNAKKNLIMKNLIQAI